ncbi:snare complex subunit [Zalerion maritima]|uniref:Snare complex subunit n=1 Tax=Zalerion maritima TaxID=339359 RepID=A0AAD5RHU1_9PEZI|nr:snare complex subunit [Zalerion maritima]
MAPPAEISIPSTSLSSDPKPHTLYTITLRLPLRSFVVQKRYNDFDTLHEALTSAVGSPPPRPLPAKTWFKSTVHNTDLTEERRVALEKYLRAIAESPDRRWRDTTAWRTFLNLPAGNSASSISNSHASARGMVAAANPATAQGATDPLTWLDLHKEVKAGLHEARLCLGKRDASAEGSTTALEASTSARRALVKVGTLLPSLVEGLRAIQDSGKLGEGEIRRRRDLLAAAKMEREGLEKIAASISHSRREGPARSSPSNSKAELLAGGGAPAVKMGRRAIGAPLPETERTRERDNEGVFQLQREMMEEQDQNVGELAKIVQRQKQLGMAIHDEVEQQTRMLEYMDNDVNRMQGKVKVVSNRTKKLGN